MISFYLHRLAVVAVLGMAAFLSGCSDSKFEKSMAQGCLDGGGSKKTCKCTMETLAESYDLKKLDEDLERRGIPLQKLQGDFAAAMFSCAKKHQ